MVEAEVLDPTDLESWIHTGLQEAEDYSNEIRALESDLREGSSSISFPLRPRSDPGKLYVAKAPADSFLRDGYSPTYTNPHGYHWATDLGAKYRTIIQLPLMARLISKGYDSAAGYWMEWEFLSGYWIHRFGRFFHMASPCGIKVGELRNRKYAVGRVGNTGNVRPKSYYHLHFELGKYPWIRKSRDPRWNPRELLRRSVVAKDY